MTPLRTRLHARRSLVLLTLLLLLAWAGAYIAQEGRSGVGTDEESIETFVPSETVSADQAVDFPVDI
ncbi:MAG: hypothetical protein AAGE94_07845 [Acidobacteriota bacterium]